MLALWGGEGEKKRDMNTVAFLKILHHHTYTTLCIILSLNIYYNKIQNKILIYNTTLSPRTSYFLAPRYGTTLTLLGISTSKPAISEICQGPEESISAHASMLTSLILSSTLCCVTSSAPGTLSFTRSLMVSKVCRSSCRMLSSRLCCKDKIRT